MQVNTESLTFATEDGKQKALVDIGGSVHDDHGKVGATFNDRLTITATSRDQLRRSSREVVYNYPIYLPPGLYQVRVGARDPASGKIGTAYEWIEIPNLSAHKLGLSSLIGFPTPAIYLWTVSLRAVTCFGSRSSIASRRAAQRKRCASKSSNCSLFLVLCSL